MEDITRGPDDPDDPDAWRWSFDDEDALRDATKGTSNGHLLLIPRFFVDTVALFFSHTKTTTTPAPLPDAHVQSASSSVSPSPFAVPSRESTFKPREETVHTATINTADKDNHAPLSREDEI